MGTPSSDPLYPRIRLCKYTEVPLEGGQRIVLLSLFSGCGGLDLGFERVGFDIGLAYDIRAHSIASWNRNRPWNRCGHVADLSTIRLMDMDCDHGGRFAPSGVIGGPPCQSFSRANSLRSADDPRSKLVRRFFSIALQFHRHRHSLDFILMENVPAMAKAENGRLLAREMQRLNENGFDAHHFLVNAACHSVPQYRNRLFVLAFPKGTFAMKRWSSPVGSDERKTVADAIQGLAPPIHFSHGIGEDEVPVHPNHWCMVPKSRRFFDGSLVEGYSSARSFKTLAWDKPSITVSYGHREVHVHPNCKRRLSVFEAMKLQGFPDDYVLEGSLSAQIDQVSEAVPPPLSETVAVSIDSAIGRATKDGVRSALRADFF